VLPNAPIEVTLPAIGFVAPSGVTAASWPGLTLPTDVSLTAVVTWSSPGPTIMMCAVVELADAFWPAVMVTSATVPAIGLTNVAAAMFCCAAASCAFAASTAAWSAAIWSADAGADDPDEPLRLAELPDEVDGVDGAGVLAVWPTAATTWFSAVDSVATDVDRPRSSVAVLDSSADA
jgi:hypothetical protein